MRERGIDAIHGSAIGMSSLPQHDLVITRGFLIHIPPAYLPLVYGLIHAAATRYIILAEYFSPVPRDIAYRGETHALWARDFMGEMLAAYPDLKLIDYGFTYKGGGDDESLNWFVAERRTC